MNQELSPGYYAVIPANVRYAKIPPNAKLLYGEITALCNDKGYCWATNGYFAELYDKTESTISVWVSALERCNFISVVIEDYNLRKIYLREAAPEGVLEKSKGGIRKIERGVLEKSKEQNNTINNTINNIGAFNSETKIETKERDTYPASPIIEDLFKTGKVTFANQIETSPASPGDEWVEKPEKRSHGRSDKAVGTSKRKPIVFPYESEDFLEAWQMWKDYKAKERGFKYKSEYSEQLALNKLARLSKGSEIDAKEIIIEAIENGWAGFWELKNKTSTINTSPELDNYKLSPEMESIYKKYTEWVAKKFPSLWKSNCRIYSKDDFYDLATDRSVTARKFHITDTEYKEIKEKSHKDLDEKAYLRSEFKTVYEYTRKLMKIEINA